MEFKWYLNAQGVRGAKGEKGDKGFSPYIVQKEVSKEKYILHVQNETEDQSFDTPNLKEGLVPEDLGGTYVRLNTETGNQYYGDADEANTDTKGVIRIASDEEVANAADVVAAVTPLQINENYSTKAETQNVEDAVTALEEKERTDIQSLGQRITGNEEDINNLTATVKQNATDITNLKSTKQNKLVAGDNVTLTDQANGTTKIDVTSSGSGEGDVKAAGDNTFTGSNTFTKEVTITGAGLKAEGGISAGDQSTMKWLRITDSVTCVGKGAFTKLEAPEAEIASLTVNGSIKYLDENDLDGQTISMVDGKVHVNMDELGNEVNDLSGRVTANETDITTLKTDMTDVTGDVDNLTAEVKANASDILTLKNSVATKQTKLTAGDNVTLTDLSDGTVKIDATSGSSEIPIASATTLGGIKVGNNLSITEDGTLSASGGSAPSNMVTTNTEQDITAVKNIISKELRFKSNESDTNYGFIKRSTNGTSNYTPNSSIDINNLNIYSKTGSTYVYGGNRIAFSYPDIDTDTGSKCYIESSGLLRGKTMMNIVVNESSSSSLNLQGAHSQLEIANGGIYIATSNTYYEPYTYGATGGVYMMVLNPISSTKRVFSPILNVNDARDYFKAGDGIVRTLSYDSSNTLVEGYTWSVGTIDGGDSTTGTT